MQGGVYRNVTAGQRTVGQTNLVGLLHTNERRLDALHRRGVPLVIDGVAVVRFLCERVLAVQRAQDFTLTWARSVAGLLNEFEADSDDAMS